MPRIKDHTLALFAIDQATGAPARGVPLLAELQVSGRQIEPVDISAAGFEQALPPSLAARSEVRNALELVVGETVGVAAFGHLESEAVDYLWDTVRKSTEALANDAELSNVRSAMVAAIQNVADSLGLAKPDYRVVITRLPLGLLVTDHLGFCSFDVSRVSHNAVPHVHDTDDATLVYRVLPMTKKGDWVDVTAQHRSFDGVACGYLTIETSGTEVNQPLSHGRAIQNPRLSDWYLSPGSFAASPELLLGEDGCARLLPSGLPISQFSLSQVVRLTEEVVTPSTDAAAGYIDHYTVSWFSLGHSLGELAYSLPLAPGESVKLAVLDWNRSDEASRSEATSLNDTLTHGTSRDRSISETVDAALDEWQRGGSVMGGVVGLIGKALFGLGGAYSTSSGSRDLAAQNVQRLGDTFAQASNGQRELRSTVVVQSTQNEKEAVETRTFTNYNHSHTLTVLYYQVLRHFRIEVRWSHREAALLVQPLGGEDLAEKEVVDYLANILRPNLLNPAHLSGFDALRRSLELPSQSATATPSSQGDLEFEAFEFGFGIAGVDKTAQPLHCFALTWVAGRGLERVGLLAMDSKNKLQPDVNLGQRLDEKYFTTLMLRPNPDSTPSRIKWRDLVGFELVRPAGADDLHVKKLQIGGFSRDGGAVLLEQRDVDHYMNLQESSVSITYINRPEPAAAAAAVGETITAAEASAIKRLLAHLDQNMTYYRQVLDATRTSSSTAQLLRSRGLLDHADPNVAGFIGDLVAYRWVGPDSPTTANWMTDGGPDRPAERLISLPTRGVFAEGELGHCNLSEEIDNTRFWQWEEHPLPIVASDINPVTLVTPANAPPNLAPSPVPQSMVNIVAPTSAPDPKGLSEALSLLSKADIFRDMSGRAEVAAVLKQLSSDLTAIEKASIDADAKAKAQGGAGTKSDAPATPPTNGIGSAVGKAVGAAAERLGSFAAGDAPPPAPAEERAAEIRNVQEELKVASTHLAPKEQRTVREAATKRLAAPPAAYKIKQIVLKVVDYNGSVLAMRVNAQFRDDYTGDLLYDKVVESTPAHLTVQSKDGTLLVGARVGTTTPFSFEDLRSPGSKVKIPAFNVTDSLPIAMGASHRVLDVTVRQSGRLVNYVDTTSKKAFDKMVDDVSGKLGIDKVVAAEIAGKSATEKSTDEASGSTHTYSMMLPTEAWSMSFVLH